MGCIRLVHTADVHLDACFAGAGLPSDFGNRRRQSLRDVFAGIVRRAGAWPADALLIAGDLFEEDRVTRDTIAFCRKAFESISHVPVFIAPGNHDPYTPNSPYASELWPENVVIFRGPEWASHSVKDGALTVYGFGFDAPHLPQNPFGALRLESRDGVHVAVAHGSERGHQPPDQGAYAPFDAVSAAVEGLAYVALGHFHTMQAIEGAFRTKMYYSGAPEGHGFKETGPRYFLEIEIEDGAVRVKPTPSARVVYTADEVDCTGVASSQDLVETIRALPDDEDLPRVARITLTGICPPEVRSAIPAAYDAVAGDFEYLDLVDETAPEEDYASLAWEETSLGAFVRTMNDEVRDAVDEDRRAVLTRAREVGLAAFRGMDLKTQGLERG